MMNTDNESNSNNDSDDQQTMMEEGSLHDNSISSNTSNSNGQAHLETDNDQTEAAIPSAAAAAASPVRPRSLSPKPALRLAGTPRRDQKRSLSPKRKVHMSPFVVIKDDSTGGTVLGEMRGDNTGSGTKAMKARAKARYMARRATEISRRKEVEVELEEEEEDQEEDTTSRFSQDSRASQDSGVSQEELDAYMSLVEEGLTTGSTSSVSTISQQGAEDRTHYIPPPPRQQRDSSDRFQPTATSKSSSSVRFANDDRQMASSDRARSVRFAGARPDPPMMSSSDRVSSVRFAMDPPATAGAAFLTVDIMGDMSSSSSSSSSVRFQDAVEEMSDCEQHFSDEHSQDNDNNNGPLKKLKKGGDSSISSDEEEGGEGESVSEDDEDVDNRRKSFAAYGSRDFNEDEDSNSEMDESVSTIDAAAAQERKVWMGLGFVAAAMVSIKLLGCVMEAITKACSKQSEEDIPDAVANEVTDELMDESRRQAMAASRRQMVGVVNPPPNQAVTQSMAVQSSQNVAASASSVGTTPQAASALAVVSSSSTSSQLALAAALAAIAAVAAVSGLFLMGSSSSDLVTPLLPPLYNCGAEVEPEVKEGRLRLSIKGLYVEKITGQEELLQDAFVWAYNNASLMCDDYYQRILQSSVLENYAIEDAANEVQVTTTTWSALVQCQGCPDIDPLFSIPNETESNSVSRRYLEKEDEDAVVVETILYDSAITPYNVNDETLSLRARTRNEFFQRFVALLNIFLQQQFDAKIIYIEVLVTTYEQVVEILIQASDAPLTSASTDSPTTSATMPQRLSEFEMEPDLDLLQEITSGPTVSSNTMPGASPSSEPISVPSSSPMSPEPTLEATVKPALDSSSAVPSTSSSVTPSLSSGVPSILPSMNPTVAPNLDPTGQPSGVPSGTPTTTSPSVQPSAAESGSPTVSPTIPPTTMISRNVDFEITLGPTPEPTDAPTNPPTESPIGVPSPTQSPTKSPTLSPTDPPTKSPTLSPTDPPTKSPTPAPTRQPFAVTGFALVDADTNQYVAGYENLQSGVTLDRSKLPPRLTIEAICDPPQIGEIRFFMDGSYVRTEKKYPYALNGDYNFSGDFKPANNLEPSGQERTLKAIPIWWWGLPGDSLEISLTVIRTEELPSGSPA